MDAMQRTRFCSRHFLFRLLSVSTALLAIGASISAASFRAEGSRSTDRDQQAVTTLESPVSPEFVPPHVHYDVTSAQLWRCSTANIGDNVMRDITTRGHQYQVEVLKNGADWVDLLISSNSLDQLKSLGLTECTSLADLNDLLPSELEQNWRTLQHHSLHPSWEVATDVASRTLERVGGKDVPNFDTQNTGSIHDHDRLKREVGDNGQESHDHSIHKEWYSQYHNFSEIYSWFYRLAEAHPDTVYLNRSIGRTYYGRDILAVHITDMKREREGNMLSAKRPKIYFQCLLHPREWISGSVCMYLAETLASSNLQSELQSLLSKVEFVIVPVANPDGYFLTWFQYPKYRLWRKNVQAFSGEDCAGVDLNRNFDVTNWNQNAESHSVDYCSELYGGPHGGSEEEVKAISNYFRSLSPVIGAIDFHSYHQEVLYPPASSYEVPDAVLNSIDRIAGSVAFSAGKVGVAYTYRKMIDVYSATGTFADWILMRSLSGEPADKCLIPLTIELRPTYEESKRVYSGFLLPATEILPVCREMLAAVITFVQQTLEHGSTCLSRL